MNSDVDDALPVPVPAGRAAGAHPEHHHPDDRARAALDGLAGGGGAHDQPALPPDQAWALLDLLDGGDAPFLDPSDRPAVEATIRALADAPAERWCTALEDRSLVVQCWAGPQALDELDRAPGELLYVARMVPGYAGAVEAYVDLDAWMQVQPRVLMGTEVRGQMNLVVRVPQATWPFRDGAIGHCALAADALEHPEPDVVAQGLATLHEAAAAYLAR